MEEFRSFMFLLSDRPAEKIDFFTDLPPEIILNLVRMLDDGSLSSAAAVSRRWREMSLLELRRRQHTRATMPRRRPQRSRSDKKNRKAPKRMRL